MRNSFLAARLCHGALRHRPTAGELDERICVPRIWSRFVSGAHRFLRTHWNQSCFALTQSSLFEAGATPLLEAEVERDRVEPDFRRGRRNKTLSVMKTAPEQNTIGPRPLQFVVGGKRIPSSDGGTFSVYDPGTGECVTDVYEATVEDVDRAVDAAKHAFNEKPWATLPANERSVCLQRLADCVEAHASEIA